MAIVYPLGCRGAGALAFLAPKEGAVVYAPIELDGSLGRVVFEAAHRDPRAPIYWHLDGEFLGETRDIHQMALAPRQGRHVLTLVDASGERVQRHFTVLGRDRDQISLRQGRLGEGGGKKATDDPGHRGAVSGKKTLLAPNG